MFFLVIANKLRPSFVAAMRQSFSPRGRLISMPYIKASHRGEAFFIALFRAFPARGKVLSVSDADEGRNLFSFISSLL